MKFLIFNFIFFIIKLLMFPCASKSFTFNFFQKLVIYILCLFYYWMSILFCGFIRTLNIQRILVNTLSRIKIIFSLTFCLLTLFEGVLSQTKASGLYLIMIFFLLQPLGFILLHNPRIIDLVVHILF